MQTTIRRDVAHNFTVNITDGAFFGFGLGFASYFTVIPLFVATLTDSPILILLVSAMHEIGWYLPQLFTAKRVARLRRYKFMTLMMTLHERLPFFGMAILALLSPHIGRELALILMFAIVIWQSFGGGFTATPWQSMIGKIMPEQRRGTFYGIQSSVANLLGSGGAVLAGVILKTIEAPANYALCFALCGTAMMISYGFLAWTRESDTDPSLIQAAADPTSTAGARRGQFVAQLMRILREDVNFRGFVAARMLAVIATLPLYCYSIFTVRRFEIDEAQIGLLTGILGLFTVAANPIFGWLGDRTSHRTMYAIAILMTTGSALIGIIAPSVAWMYIGFALLGVGKAGLWMIPLPLTSQFGKEGDRPYYIGLANTLLAPVAVAAVLIGGAISSGSDFNGAFGIALTAGLASAALLLFVVRDPHGREVLVVDRTLATSMD